MVMLLPKPWEYGSEYHWITGTEPEASSVHPWDRNAGRCGSGRDALRVLLAHGRARLGWRRLWIPSYFCQEVVAVMLGTGIEVALYLDGPDCSQRGFEPSQFRAGDALFVVNFFGLRARPGYEGIDRTEVAIVEDHTHDPWSSWAFESTSDWCIASMRKTLPVPDGGIVWSPRRHALPPIPPATLEREKASLAKLAAMALKTLYLEGHAVSKEDFRRLAVLGESNIAVGEISGMPEWTACLLDTFPISAWRATRQRNHGVLSQALAGLPWLRILQPEPSRNQCPFSAVLLFDTTGRREYVRQKLIASRVYPAILWPLEKPIIAGIPQKHKDLSLRMLSIHCDMRYEEHDMDCIGALVRELGMNYVAGSSTA